MNLRKLLGMKAALPAWAKWEKDNQVAVDVSVAYPLYLAWLEPHLGRDVDQYVLNVAQRCITNDVKAIVKTGAKDQGLLVIRYFDPTPDRAWRFRNYPEGRGGDRGRQEFAVWHEKIKGAAGR